jgi:nitroreductase/ketosteroid isomerase-like protein
MKRTLFFLSFLILTTFNLSNDIIAQNNPDFSLKETFDLYVKSVQNTDLEGLFSTVTDSERFCFLTSNGELINSRQAYYKFHENWFKETNWEMPVELLETHEAKDYGYTIAIFHYKQELPEGGKYNLDSYFTLIYHKENGKWKVITDICTPIKRYFSGSDPEIEYDSRQKYLFDIIENRRTVRNFKSTPVPREHIMKIIESAHFAPTAGNQQPWKFLVIQDRNKLDKLKEEALSWYMESYISHKIHDMTELESTEKAIKATLENVLSAPVYIAVLVDSEAKYPDYIVYDGSLAAGYLMIAARALGYGTGFFTTFFPENKMKLFFNIPNHYKLICFTPIGIPVEWPEKPSKKALEELVIFDSF